MGTRTYGQYCAAATALDVVGDRWTLLVVRELLSGPKRYTDLRDGLPGIPTDLLAARLRHLEDEGLAERSVLPPPAASKVYALTEDGAALEPVLMALARWGMRRLSAEQDGAFRLHWLVLWLRSMFVPAAAPEHAVTVDFVVDGERLRARFDRRAITFDHYPAGPAGPAGPACPAEPPDVTVTGDPTGIAALGGDRARRLAAISEGRVTAEGAPHTIAALQRALGLE